MAKINDIPSVIKSSDMKFKIGGVFTHQHIRNGKVIGEWETDDNIVVDEGLNYVLGSSLSADSVLTAFYIGLFKNNYTPVSTNVISTFPGSGVANEATSEYSEANRVLWVDGGPIAKVLTNTASPAVFTFASPITIYGAFLASSQAKAATTGKLIAASQFSSSRAMLTADVLNVVYNLTISST